MLISRSTAVVVEDRELVGIVWLAAAAAAVAA